ncbi:NAD(P)-binding domain-containing protein [Isoptericola sp. F-RaC21]|uniref:NADPH-dependent F420 reductase n=1 Tax=Isoptericola sp. F-RaC21 TaxID=3141452 RepID=UPI00315C436F
MARLGIIGSGAIGSAVARLAVAADLEVLIANSRGPESLADLVAELGAGARAGTSSEAAAFADQVVVAVPLTRLRDLPLEALAGKVVVDTGNYYPHRDGRIAELDALELTTGEYAQQLLAGAHVVKAFNNILARHIPLLARPAGAHDRSALPIAGDDDGAKAAAARLVDRLGFDTVDAGGMSEGWRFEPEAAAYTQAYAAEPSSLAENYLTDPGKPLPVDALRALLAGARRPDVAARAF